MRDGFLGQYVLATIKRAAGKVAVGAWSQDQHGINVVVVEHRFAHGRYPYSPTLTAPFSSDFTDMARACGLEPRTRLLHRLTRGASFDEAETLGIAPSASVLELVRLRSLDRLAVCIDTNVLCRGMDELATLDFTDRSLYQSLDERCGIRVTRCSYTVQAIAAGKEHAD